MFLVTPLAVDMQASWDATVQFLKFLAFYGLVIGTLRTRAAFDAFAAMHIAGAAWWGWEAFLDPKRSQSRLLNVGSSDTLNDNLASAHLLTVLPFVFVYLFTAEDKRLRALALVAMPLVVNLMILCNSRGGIVGLVVAMAAAFVLAKHGHRSRLVGGLVAMVLSFLMLADPEFIMRQQTTLNYKSEGTAVERVSSWQGGLELIKDYPYGAGGKGFAELSPRYIPAVVAANYGEKRAPHNTYVLVASEWGIQGLVLYLGLIGSTFVMLHQIKKRSQPKDGYFYRAFAIQVGLIGTLTASTFSDRFYGESFYWMCALTVVLFRVQLAAATAGAPAPQPVTERPRPLPTAGWGRREEYA
jgi:O-antigen ligase